MLRYSIRKLIFEALGDEDITKEQTVSLFKSWFAKFYKEWKDEQFKETVRILSHKKNIPQEEIDKATEQLKAETEIKTKVVSTEKLTSFVIFWKFPGADVEQRNELIIFDWNTNQITYRFGHWDAPQTPEERMKGTFQFSDLGNVVGRLRQVVLPFRLFEHYIEASNNLNEFKSNLIKYTRMQKQKPQ